jgi:integrase
MATLGIRGQYRTLNWQDAQGRHRISIGKVGVISDKAAQDILKAKELELSTGAQLLGLGIARAITFGQYAGEYLTWHRSEYPHSHFRVRQIVQDHLLPRFALTPLDFIQPKEVEQYKRDRRTNAADATVIKELRTLKAILNRAVKDRLINYSPIEHVAAPRDLTSKPHRFYEKTELDAIYRNSAVHQAMWKLYANTGMRRMEGINLKWKNIGSDGLKILSESDARTKSGEWRDIPLGIGAAAALEEIKRDGEYVLPRIAPPSISRAFINDARRANLDGSLHTLRHTYISHLVRAGTPLRTVQIYAGHAHYSTTEKYSYLQPGMVDKRVLNLSL